jgi:GntR family transcriptional regulator, transcriptional repressor for pyruvate dehydrogenase complex
MPSCRVKSRSTPSCRPRPPSPRSSGSRARPSAKPYGRCRPRASLGLVLREGIENLLQLGTIEISEASAVRTILEVPAAQLAAENRTDSDLVHLQSALDRLAKAPVDDPEIPTLDAEFHTRIALASGNRVLSCLVFALHRASEPVRHLDLTSDTAREGHRQHRALLTAIRDRDAQGAGAAMTTHLSYLRSHPREHVDRGTG